MTARATTLTASPDMIAEDTYSRNRIPAATPAAGRSESITDLLKELRDESMTLVRQEVALAKTEMSEKVSRVGRNLGYLAAGGLVAVVGAIFLLTALVAGVQAILVAIGLEEVAGWLAPLLVGATIGLIGYGLIQKALTTLKHESLVPEKTVQTLKEDKEWITNKTR